MKKDLLRVTDLSREDLDWILRTTKVLKEENKKGQLHRHLDGKSLGMLFQKSSTRTRISFEVGMYQLGGNSVMMSADQLQMSRGEVIEDSARIFSRYLDALVIRTSSQTELDKLASKADIPIINALTDKYHPCQILTDIFTITERKESLTNIKIAYIGDGNNVAHSWLLGASIAGMQLIMATPEGYGPDSDVVEQSMLIAEQSGANIELCHSPLKASKDADVLYTDTWVSMGQENEAAEKCGAFKGFCIDQELVGTAKDSVMIMHCLPAHRGEEISGDVLDWKNSVVWDQAENRLHTQKAILLLLLHDCIKEIYP